MEIPSELLENLKCSCCNNYLSRRPIYLGHDGAAICGLCYSPNIPAIRNKDYETVIKLLRFPCKNRDLGCLETVPFVEDSEVMSHEEVCSYRQHVCPIFDSSRCDWVGIRKDLLKHCEEQHADTVKDSPVTLTYDITISKEQNYLLRAFRDLFLLHTKVSIASGRICHAVRYLGMLENAENFTFNVEIRRNDIQFSRKGFVSSVGCLTVQELRNTTQVFNITSLLDMLDGFEGTTFTIAIEQLSSAVEKCVKCGALISVLLYGTENGYLCVRCIPDETRCMRNPYGYACNFTDIPVKCTKHFQYFCFCDLCQSSVSLYSFSIHFNTTHVCQYTTNPWVVMKKTGKVFLAYNAVTAICEYFSGPKKLTLNLYIPVKSYQLYKYKCTVRISQLNTENVCIYKPNSRCDTVPDWTVEVTPTDFPSWSYEFSVSVDITE